MSCLPPPPPPPPAIKIRTSTEPEARPQRLEKEKTTKDAITTESHPTKGLLLHENWDLLESAAKLLEGAWPGRQHTRKLSQSCATLPTSVVLIDVQTQKAVGYAWILAVVGSKDAVLIESVVVDESERGRGYGRRLMEFVHSYAKNTLGKTTAHLSTKDPQTFY